MSISVTTSRCRGFTWAPLVNVLELLASPFPKPPRLEGVSGAMEPVLVHDNRLLVMPGSLLTTMTGDGFPRSTTGFATTSSPGA